MSALLPVAFVGRYAHTQAEKVPTSSTDSITMASTRAR